MAYGEGMIVFFVQGIAKTKGSKRAVPIYRGKRGQPREFTGKAVVLDDNRPALKDWEAHVRYQAMQAMTGRSMLDEPLELSLRFRLLKPKNRPKRLRTWPDKAPDLDKLIRAVKDALRAVVYRDDALVCRYGPTDKDWGDPPGVLVMVRSLREMCLTENAFETASSPHTSGMITVPFVAMMQKGER